MITIKIDEVTYDIKPVYNEDGEHTGMFTIFNPDLGVTHTNLFTGKFVEFRSVGDAINSLIKEENLLFA